MILLLISFVLIVMMDFVPLIQQKLWKDAIVSGVILGVALAVSVLHVAGVQMPSPLLLLSQWLESMHISY